MDYRAVFMLFLPCCYSTITLIPPAPRPVACPPGWLPSLYLDHCYYVSAHAATAASARDFCAENGTTLLLRWHSLPARDNGRLFEEMQPGKGYWLGLEHAGDTWRWLDESPHNQEVIDEQNGDCAMFTRTDETYGKFYRKFEAADCGEEHYFFCHNVGHWSETTIEDLELYREHLIGYYSGGLLIVVVSIVVIIVCLYVFIKACRNPKSTGEKEGPVEI